MPSTTLRRGVALALIGIALGAAPAALAQTVAKTVDSAIYNVRSLWTIDKTADASEVLLSCDQTFLVNYTVTVRKVARTGEQFPEGTITVTNTTGGSVTLNDLDDIVQATSDASIEVPLEVTCPVTLPHVMAPGDVLVCTYEGRVLEPTELQVHNLNEAIATFAGGPVVSSGLIPYNIQFGAETDLCIEVSDDLAGFLGTVCMPNTPTVFNYSGTIGPFGASGTYPIVNTASFYGQDSGPGGAPDPDPNPSGGSASGEDSVTVTAIVSCEGGGCSLTQGYWKTHSEFGPAPYDETWAELSNGASTLFLNTSVSWYTLFHTPPSGGNGYIQLAHQWMAAKLNELAGADVTILGTALADAQTLMTNNPGCRTNWRSNTLCPASVRAQFGPLASLLADYNEGELPGGPEHCSGEETSGANALVGDGSTFALGAPAPNPTNGSSSIKFDVPESSQVLLVAYDVMGREVARLADDFFQTGTHEVIFDGANLPAGTYFIRMSAGEFHDVTRVVIAR